MTQSRTELINIVGRILASGDWDDPYATPDIGSKEDVRALAEEIVTALRPEANDEPQAPVNLNKWHPDCGGDWNLSGPGYFACYWPDNTVSAMILDAEGNQLDHSGVKKFHTRSACQTFAELWIRERL